MTEALLPKHLLLTGGRGCLARVIRQHFTAQGTAVTSLSRVAGDGHFALEDLFASGLIDQADALIHLAWSSVRFRAARDPRREWEQDLPLLGKILERIATSPRGQRLHFVFFSSGGTVYGNARDRRPSREDDPCEPIGCHGRAKLAAERLIEEAGRQHGLIGTILRISNPYGFPVPASRPQGIVPLALTCARAGRPLTVWGDGTARKDFLHHSDFLAALEKVLRGKPPGVFNVCSGESHSIQEVVALAERATGCRITTVHAPAQPWDVHDSLLDNTKLRNALDWRPVVPLAEGIRRAAAELASR